MPPELISPTPAWLGPLALALAGAELPGLLLGRARSARWAWVWRLAFAGVFLAVGLGLSPLPGWLGPCVLAALALAWSLRWTQGLAVSALTRATLVSLRSATLLLVLGLLVVQPAWTATWRAPGPSGALLMQDVSRSLRLADAGTDDEPLSRWEASQRAWEDAQPAVRALQASWAVSAWAVSEELAPVAWAEGLPRWPEPAPLRVGVARQADRGTALADGILRALGQAPTAPRALVLLSDGADTASDSHTLAQASAALDAAGVAVLACVVGQGQPTPNTRQLRLAWLSHPPRAVVGQELRVVAQGLLTGLAGVSVRASLRADGQPVAEVALTPTQAHQELGFSLAFVPQRAGPLTLEVRAQAQPPGGPALEDTLSAQIMVTSERWSALLVEAKPRREAGALAAALTADPRVALTVALLPASAQPGEPSPLDGMDWKGVRLLVLGDVPAERWPAGELRRVANAVRGGMGLILMGGRESLAAYADTPLAELSPGQDLAQCVDDARPTRPRPAPGAEADPLLTLAANGQTGPALWAALPEHQGRRRLGPLRPTARALMVDEAGEPLLAMVRVGKGTVLQLACDEHWRWQRAREDGGSLLRQWWGQLARAAASATGDLWLATDRTRYDWDGLRRGERSVAVTAGWAGEPATVNVTLTGPDGVPAPVPLTGALGALQATLRPAAPGSYVLNAVALANGRELANASAAFSVDVRDRELERPLADVDAMRSLAQATARQGGQLLTPAQLPAALAQLAANPPAAQVERTATLRPASDLPWAVWAVIFTLLSAEWAVRRRAGLD